MNFTEYIHHYEIKQRQNRLNNLCFIKTAFDEKLFLKTIFSRGKFVCGVGR